MPLLIVFLIGMLAFGLFDLTLGRPLPIADVKSGHQDIVYNPTEDAEDAEPPSIPTVAASQVARCDPHDAACRLVTLYRFVLTAVVPEWRQRPWLHAQQHPARTLFMKSGDPVDIAILFSSLLDQQHIRNYLIVLPEDSYVLACDITPTALHHAGGNWVPATSVFDENLITPPADPTIVRPSEWINAYALNVGDAPCPCLLLDPSEPLAQEPGAPLLLAPGALRSALDLRGQRHALVVSGP
jgi:hypothetical protein